MEYGFCDTMCSCRRLPVSVIAHKTAHNPENHKQHALRAHFLMVSGGKVNCKIHPTTYKYIHLALISENALITWCLGTIATLPLLTEDTERSPMDRPPLHLPQAVTLPPAAI
jgi:hypothetical protein